MFLSFRPIWCQAAGSLSCKLLMLQDLGLPNIRSERLSLHPVTPKFLLFLQEGQVHLFRCSIKAFQIIEVPLLWCHHMHNHIPIIQDLPRTPARSMQAREAASQAVMSLSEGVGTSSTLGAPLSDTEASRHVERRRP